MLTNSEIIIENGIIKDILPADNLYITNIDNNEIVSRTQYNNAYAYPGYIDSHGHLLGLGMVNSSLSLYDINSAEECIDKALSFNYETRGNWVVGIGWNQELWTDKKFPTKEILDRAFPNTPVYLIRADAHSAWVNSKAIEIAIKDFESSNLADNLVLKNDKNEISGVLIDSAMNIVSRHIPDFTDSQKMSMLIKAQNLLLSNGITSICEMESDSSLIKILKAMEQTGELNLNIYAYLKANNDEYLNCSLQSSKQLKISGIKLFADGALGSRGASLFEPYSDDRNNYGKLLLSENDIYNKTKNAFEKGLSTAVHCIGDRANHSVAIAFAKFRKHINRDSVLRMEHVQIIQDSDISLLSDNNITASIQPVHCLSDAPNMVESRIGLSRANNAYRWKSLLDRNINVVAGSDFPIESFDPIRGMYALTNRIPYSTLKPWNESEVISLQEAINSYTINTQKAVQDNSIGELKIGNRADINVLNGKITTMHNNINELLIDTYSAGKLVVSSRQ